MYQRSIKSSGGSDHVELVKLATKRIVDEFEEINEIVINYEQEIDVNIKPDFESRFGRTNVRFAFRPDIAVTTTKFKHENEIDPEKRKIWQAHRVFFEAETDPRNNLFKNLLKVECYKKMRRGGFFEFAFVLVCFEDAKLPKNTKPFDEIWTFPRKEET